MVFNDPKANQVRTLKRAPRQVAVATDLRHASVSGGRTRFIGSNSLVIEGSSSTTGTANVSGTQNVTGSTNLNGPVSIAGNQTVTGVLNQNGPWNLSGAGGISGNVSLVGTTTMTGSLNVTGGGAINLGGLHLRPVGSWAEIASDTHMVLSASSVTSNGLLYLNQGIELLGGQVKLGVATTGVAANAYIDPTTKILYRSTSAAKFKIDAQPLTLSDDLLTVKMKDWVDQGQAERFADLLDSPRPLTAAQQEEFDSPGLKRIPGYIADEVAAIDGGEAFVLRDADGEIDSLMYDRFVGAKVDKLTEKLEQAMALIEDLQKQVTSLSAKPATP